MQSKKTLLTVIALFASWRISLFVIAALAPIFIPVFGAKFPYFQERLIATGFPNFIWSFGNFDGVHYLGIAKEGYAYQFTQAFFPLYPILIRIFSNLTLGNFLLGGLIVSNVFFIAGLFIFFELVKQKYDSKTAAWSTVFLLTFPTSFYFGSIYTEGLFFFLVIFYFYLLENKKNLFSSAVGAFASFTRLIGIILAVSLLIKPKMKNFLFALIILSGLLAYVLYLKLEFNNPFYFLTSQTAFGQERSTGDIILLPQVIYRYIKIFITASGQPLINAVFEFAATIFAVGILILGRKKIPGEWFLFSVISILVPTLTGTLASMPRYVLLAFPVFIILAQIKSLALKITIAVIFAILLLISTAFFTRGYWVA